MTEDRIPVTDSPDRWGDNRSLGELLGDVTRDLSTLLRQEVQLARAELRETATQGGKSVGMFAGAGIAGHFVLLFVSIALWWAIGSAIGLAWSAVVVALLWAALAAVLYVMARREMERVRGLPRTAETASKIPNALKGKEEENR